ncbi:MAG: methyltransferase family protein [Anaerolineae bacterium]
MPFLRVYGRWIVLTILVSAVLFGAAGRCDLPIFWAFVVAHSGSHLALTLIVFRSNLDLLEERQRPGEGAKTWDRVLLSIYIVVAMAILVVAGLDVGRFHWSDTVPLWLQVVGLAVFVISFAFDIWAIAVNNFYSRVVRIQEDRGQYVVTDGPYRFVRHPSYMGSMVSWLCTALALGSWRALLPAVLVGLVFVVRTALEDRTLHEELPGYVEYAQRVRYRLLPGVW